MIRRVTGRAAAIALVLAGAVVWQAPAAQAVLYLAPSISGSGTISGSIVCTATDKATGALTPCSNRTTGSVVLVATPQATPVGHWRFDRWENCPVATGATCTIADTTIYTAVVPRAVFSDSVGPTLSPTATYSSVQDRSVALTWATNEPLSAATCAVDGGTAVPCTSGSFAPVLSEGSHTLTATGTDLSGNVGAAVSLPVRIVDTVLLDGPADVSGVAAPVFTVGSLTGTRFECSLDAAPFSLCATKGVNGQASIALPAVADGVHRFRVRAADGSDVDRVPVDRSWTVDTVAPTVALDPTRGANEGALQAATTETFVFAPSEAGSSTSCRLDGAAFAPCSSPATVSGLAPGPHVFEVRATDVAGNTGPAATRSWSVAGSAAQAAPTTPAVPTAKPVSLSVAAKATKRRTTITSLTVVDVAAGTSVRVSCRGAGCPKALRGKGLTQTASGSSLALTSLVRRPLAPGTKLNVAVTSGSTTTTFVVKVRAGKKPSVVTR